MTLPNLSFLNLVIRQYNISSNVWIFEYFLNRLCPIFFFLKLFVCAGIVWKHLHMCFWVRSCHSTLFHQNFAGSVLLSYFPLLKWFSPINMVKKTLLLVTESVEATVKHFNKFSRFHKFFKLMCPTKVGLQMLLICWL